MATRRGGFVGNVTLHPAYNRQASHEKRRKRVHCDDFEMSMVLLGTCRKPAWRLVWSICSHQATVLAHGNGEDRQHQISAVSRGTRDEFSLRGRTPHVESRIVPAALTSEDQGLPSVGGSNAENGPVSRDSEPDTERRRVGGLNR